MPDVSAIPIVGDVVETIAGVFGGNEADDEMQQATQQASDQQLQMYNQMREDLAPYRESGTNFLRDYGYQTSYGAMDPTALYTYRMLHDYVTGERPEFSFAGVEDPSIGYIQDQARRATESSAAAKGGLLSGGAQKALQKNAGNIASTYWQNAYQNALNKYAQDVGAYGTGVGALQNLFSTYQNNRQNYLQSLLSGAQMGQNAATATGTEALNTGNQLASNALLSGVSGANAAVNQTNAITGLLGNVAGRVGAMDWGNWSDMLGQSRQSSYSNSAPITNAISNSLGYNNFGSGTDFSLPW